MDITMESGRQPVLFCRPLTRRDNDDVLQGRWRDEAFDGSVRHRKRLAQNPGRNRRKARFDLRFKMTNLRLRQIRRDDINFRIALLLVVELVDGLENLKMEFESHEISSRRSGAYTANFSSLYLIVDAPRIARKGRQRIVNLVQGGAGLRGKIELVDAPHGCPHDRSW